MRAFRALVLVLFAIHLTVAAPSMSEAASAAAIDADVDATLHSFESQIPGARRCAADVAISGGLQNDAGRAWIAREYLWLEGRC